MKALLVALMFSPLVALAQPRSRPPPSEEKREQMADRMRMMMVVGLAEALELSEGEALKLGEKIRSFESRRRPLRETMFESMRTLHQASQGDSAALAQVDSSTQKLLDARIRMAELDREMFNELARGLSAEKKAKLATFLARFQQEVKAGFGKGKGMRGHRER
ncbi:MAG: hypothetical protein ACOZIN_19800 [Myxococcota bacterium]